MQELASKGYLVLKQVLTHDQLEDAKGAIYLNEKVNYSKMIKFINSAMMKRINDELGFDAIYTKFRVSNNNNSTDASTFHRDIICHEPNKKVYPIYTCLSYLDSTVMEVIPGTHLHPVMSYVESVVKYPSRVRLNLNPGDLLIFYSTLLHRGIFTEKLNNRRLIQVFEVYPNYEDKEKYADKILHLPADAKDEKTNAIVGNLMIGISKLKPLIEVTNMLGYFNASTGYGYHSKPLDKYNLLNHFTYASSEAKQKRIGQHDEDDNNSWQDINLYAINNGPNGPSIHDIPSVHKNDLFHIQYTRQIFMYILLIVICIVLLVAAIFKGISKYCNRPMSRRLGFLIARRTLSVRSGR
jgi:hypothetical protein